MKQYSIRFNMADKTDTQAYNKLMQHTKDKKIRDFILDIIEKEYQRQLIINTIKNDIEKYKKEN